MDIKSHDHYNSDGRLDQLKSADSYLKLLICEVRDELLKKNKQLPKCMTRKKFPVRRKVDTTYATILDYSVVKSYGDFLKRYLTTRNKKGRKNKSGSKGGKRKNGRNKQKIQKKNSKAPFAQKLLKI